METLSEQRFILSEVTSERFCALSVLLHTVWGAQRRKRRALCYPQAVPRSLQALGVRAVFLAGTGWLWIVPSDLC